MRANRCSDAKYTHESHIYQAVVNAINCYDDYPCNTSDLIKKMMERVKEIWGMDSCEMEMFIRQGWSEAEQLLKEKFWKLLDHNVKLD